MPDFSKIVYGGVTYTVKDGASRSALVELIDSGPKNKIEMTQTQETITKGNITATFDKVAGTITLNGYNTSGNSAIFEFYSGNADTFNDWRNKAILLLEQSLKNVFCSYF